MRFNAYKIISDAVEKGAQYGYNRAHKHVDNPSEVALINAIADAVMSEIGEVLHFDDPRPACPCAEKDEVWE
jgi:hypothetical protein